MKNFWIPNFLKISRSTTFVLGKTSFEQWFEKNKIWNFSAFENVLFKAELKVFFKFHAETWNLAKIKIGEEEKFHNIDVGQKLIRVLDLGENRGQG